MNILKKVFLLFVLFYDISLNAQTILITRECNHMPYSSVLALYKNEFGKLEDTTLDDPFPYALIRIGLDGNEREVKLAKQHLMLYLGAQIAVEAVCKDKPNEILFLVPKRANHIYLHCGDSCEQVLLFEQGSALFSNGVYYCRVHYIPSAEGKHSQRVDIDTRLLSNLETKFDSLQSEARVDTILLQTLTEQIDDLQTDEKVYKESIIIRHPKRIRRMYDIEEFSYGDTNMDQKALGIFLKNNSPKAYKKYRLGKPLSITGWCLLGVGAALIPSYCLYDSFQHYENGIGAMPKIGIFIEGTLIVVPTAITLLSIGYHYQNNTYKIFNEEQKNKKVQVSLDFQIDDNGVGVALNF